MSHEISVYIHSDPFEIGAAVYEMAGVEPQIWTCQCHDPDCPVYVAFGRRADGRVFFWGNFASDPNKYGGHTISNVEDFALMLACEDIDPIDRSIFRMLFDRGLRDALLNA